jgi:hypothetical protein
MEVNFSLHFFSIALKIYKASAWLAAQYVTTDKNRKKKTYQTL